MQSKACIWTNRCTTDYSGLRLRIAGLFGLSPQNSRDNGQLPRSPEITSHSPHFL
jgi:hypothetical protein